MAISLHVKIIFGVLAVIGLCWCIYRDIQLDKQRPRDLRNRIVGARLQMDGTSPYFYKWKSSDGIRYYDQGNFSSAYFSNVTATPFFHQLLSPIANLPQRTVSQLWLVLQYLALLAMTILAFRMATYSKNKPIVIVTGLLFLFTIGWIRHVWVGQIYLFFALAAMLFYFFLVQPPTLLNAALTGIFAVSIVLARPTTILFLLPFLLLLRRFTAKYLIIFGLSGLVILLLAFGSSSSRMYWWDYRNALKEHVKSHQGMEFTLIKTEPDPKYSRYEGWDSKEIDMVSRDFPYPVDSENGNVFVLAKLILNKKIPLWALYISCLVFMLAVIMFFLKTHYRKASLTTYSVALLGFCLYMASDIFAPIHRHSYNSAQWIFPLLLIAGYQGGSLKRIYLAGLIAGFLLICLPYSLLLMQRSIGEYIIFASILGIMLNAKAETT